MPVDRSRASTPEAPVAGVAHDAQPLVRRRPTQGIGRVGQAVLVQRTGEDDLRRHRDGRRQHRGDEPDFGYVGARRGDADQEADDREPRDPAGPR